MSKKEQDQYFEDNPGSRRKRKKGAGKTILIILLFIVMIGAGGVFLINRFLDRIGRIDPKTQTTLSPSEAQELIDRETQSAPDPSETAESKKDIREVTVDPNETYVVEINGETRVVPGSEINENPSYTVIGQFNWEKAEPLQDGDLLNILLLGIDARKKGQVSRTDTMILLSIDPRTHRMSMVSFMRDLYLPIHEGYEDSRLNHAYEIGGLAFLYECLENNFGLDYTGNSVSASALHAGVCHLDGNAALAYCRIRKLDDDFHRTARQRAVMTALFNKMKSADLNTLNDLLNKAMSMSATDMSNADIWTSAAKVLPYLASTELSSYRIPCDGSCQGVYIRGMSVVQAVQKTNIDYLKSVLPF